MKAESYMLSGNEFLNAVEMFVTEQRVLREDYYTNEYEVDFTFFIGLGVDDDEYKESVTQKDRLLDLLDTMPEIVNYEVENDGEDWCINCIANVTAKSIKQVDTKMRKLLYNTDCAWDYHYIKGINNDEYWQP